LAGDGIKKDSRPTKIREQPQRECGQIHTKVHEEFSPEKVIQHRPEYASSQASNRKKVH
jgi:hypothetical protein